MTDDFDPLAFLRDQGVPADLIAQARDEGWLAMLVIDRWLLPGDRVHTNIELAAQAGVDVDHANALWRAIGFPDVPDDLAMFTDQDRNILQLGAARLAVGDDPDRHIAQVRAISGAMSRVAELFSDELLRLRDDAMAAGADDEAVAAAIPRRLDLDTVSQVIDYVLRRQLAAAMWRRVATRLRGDGEVAVTVGFADLVGYTALSQQLGAAELTELVVWFEETTADLITNVGGRVIKRIGDAVMFAVSEPSTGVDLALDMVDAVAARGHLLRVGLAHGPVVGHEGDLFGTPVNLASRLQTMARPGRVVINEAVHDAIADRDDFHIRSLGRRRIKDLGTQRLWRLRRDPPEPADPGDDEASSGHADDSPPGQAEMFADAAPTAPPTGAPATTRSRQDDAVAPGAPADTTVVFTDGACSGNPGPGGWAWAATTGAWASGAENPSTNQRMEIMAAFAAVQAIPGALEIVSDSTYVVKCFNDGWWRGWHKRGWRNAKREPVANRDLWEPFVDLVNERGDVTFRWVKGHSGDPMNDLVDALAVQAAQEGRGRSGDRHPDIAR